MEDPNGRSFQKVEEPSAQKHRNKILVQWISSLECALP
jgi:hypothetical protein